MKAENKEERARQIEQTAYDILEEKGFSGLSMQAIARKTRASNETLYRWYGDKTGLFEALIRRNSAIVKDAITHPTSAGGLDQLREVGTVLLTMLLSPRAIALNRAAAADPSGVLGRALAREGRDSVAPRIVGLMELAQRSGDIAGASPQEMAETFFALLIGDLQIRCVTGALQVPRPAFVQQRAKQSVAQLVALYPSV